MAVVNEKIRCSARFKYPGVGDVVNVWYFIMQIAGETDEDVMDAIEARLDTAYSGYSSHLATDMYPYDLRFDVVDVIGGLVKTVRVMGARSWTLTTPPAGTGDPLPPMNAAIINFRTLFPKVFGRKYIGVLTESSGAIGQMVGAAFTALETFAALMITDIAMTTGELGPGTVSLKAGAGSLYWAQFVGGVVNFLLGTQRRRRQGVGS